MCCIAPDDDVGGERRRRLHATLCGAAWGRFFVPRIEEGSSMETIEGSAGVTADLRQKVLRDVEQAEVKFIRLWFTDLVGRLKSFAITRDELASALDHGMGFDGSSVTGFTSIEECDMIAMRDPATFRMMPPESGEHASARMFCDIRTPDGEPYEADSRQVLRSALDRMAGLGFDSFKIGPELEFFLFRMD